ncbi:MAG: hypothetical protein ACOX21_00355 [Bacillota bacterium]|jgi:hypothetical protein|nr:hypothetical protein [Bacillota bacterium]HPZ22525.1 hypothetical protein [Bacillota bacterium]HQD19808.1 hypothetical protein [Bacillota bacterium]
MKRVLAVFLLLLMVVSVAACGEVPAPSTGSGDKTGEGGKNTPDPPPEQVSIVEEIVIEEKGILIKVTGLEESWMGPELKVYIENNSDVPITAQVRNTSINGFMIEPIFSCDVVPGKKASDTIDFSGDVLEEHNIDVITEIELYFHVFNTSTWDTIFDSQTVKITTTAAGKYTQTYDSSGELLLDQAGIKIVFKGMGENIFGPEVLLYIENNTSQAVTIQARDTSVNGYMVDAIFSCDIVPGKKALDDITFYEDDLLANGIDAIAEIELRFHIFNTDTWADILDSEVITIAP